MPNYSQILVSSIASGYTSTVRGWLVGSLGKNNATIELYINGVRVAMSSQGVNANAYVNISIPISVGDVITFSGSPTVNYLQIIGIKW